MVVGESQLPQPERKCPPSGCSDAPEGFATRRDRHAILAEIRQVVSLFIFHFVSMNMKMSRS